MPSVDQDVEQLELPTENAKWYSCSETVWQFLRTVNTLLANDPAILLQRDENLYLHKKPVHEHS